MYYCYRNMTLMLSDLQKDKSSPQPECSVELVRKMKPALDLVLERASVSDWQVRRDWLVHQAAQRLSEAAVAASAEGLGVRDRRWLACLPGLITGALHAVYDNPALFQLDSALTTLCGNEGV